MPCCARCEGCGKQSNQVPATQAFQEKFAANVPADEQLNTVETWHDACAHRFLLDKHSLLSMLAWKKGSLMLRQNGHLDLPKEGLRNLTVY